MRLSLGRRSSVALRRLGDTYTQGDGLDFDQRLDLLLTRLPQMIRPSSHFRGHPAATPGDRLAHIVATVLFTLAAMVAVVPTLGVSNILGPIAQLARRLVEVSNSLRRAYACS